MNNKRLSTGLLVLALIDVLLFAPTAFSQSTPKGKLSGYVQLPVEVDIATAAEEAKVYIYLLDYTSRKGKTPFPWEAPITRVEDMEIRALKSHKVMFQFRDLPAGTYGVSVLIDTGRPHVRPGSKNFTAFPGDYAGGTKENVKLENNQSIEVSIEEGLYVSVPDDYKAPVYSPE